jgi:uncharacterized membrane protein (DUF485 family)
MFFMPVPYIKKEDARAFVNLQRKSTAFILMGTVAIMAILQILVGSRIDTLYIDLRLSVPWLTKLSPYITTSIGTLAVVGALYLLISKPDHTKLDLVLQKYKDGEMIRTGELVDRKTQWLLFGVIVFIIVYIVLVTVIPIYSLTI